MFRIHFVTICQINNHSPFCSLTPPSLSFATTRSVNPLFKSMVTDAHVPCQAPDLFIAVLSPFVAHSHCTWTFTSQECDDTWMKFNSHSTQPPLRPTYVTCAVKVAPQKPSVDLVASHRFAGVASVVITLLTFPHVLSLHFSVACTWAQSRRWLLRHEAMVPLNALLMILLYIRRVVGAVAVQGPAGESKSNIGAVVIVGKYFATWLHWFVIKARSAHGFR